MIDIMSSAAIAVSVLVIIWKLKILMVILLKRALIQEYVVTALV